MPVFKFFESEPEGILFAPPIFEGDADSKHPGFTGTVLAGVAAFKTDTWFSGRIPVPTSRISGAFPLERSFVGTFVLCPAVINGALSIGTMFSGNFAIQPPVISGTFAKNKLKTEFNGEFLVSIGILGSSLMNKKFGCDEDFVLKYSRYRNLI